MQELIINQDSQKNRIYAIIENGILLECYEEKAGQARMEGNIYLGTVVNILQGMQAAFVNIGEGKNTFIHMKDILPKQDVSKMKEEPIQDRNIKEVVKQGDMLLVQVKRDSTKQKGARVSTHLSLNSRYFVLMPCTDILTISQKIEEQKEKERLLTIVKEILPKGCGVIIRTAAKGKKKEELEQDLKQSVKRWKEIKKKAEEEKEQKNAPVLIEENNNMMEKLLMDTVGTGLNKITVNSKELFKVAQKVSKRLALSSIEIMLQENQDLITRYELEGQLEKMENRKIWLKCGGFITIDKTEALVAIDVNSGKYTGNKNLEQTVLKVNREATEEIAKQIRLRDMGGIIVIDYIDMEKEEHKKEIEELLKQKLKKDRSKTQVVGFTKLNLLEMTRKHMFSHD